MNPFSIVSGSAEVLAHAPAGGVLVARLTCSWYSRAWPAHGGSRGTTLALAGRRLAGDAGGLVLVAALAGAPPLLNWPLAPAVGVAMDPSTTRPAAVVRPASEIELPVEPRQSVPRIGPPHEPAAGPRLGWRRRGSTGRSRKRGRRSGAALDRLFGRNKGPGFWLLFAWARASLSWRRGWSWGSVQLSRIVGRSARPPTGSSRSVGRPPAGWGAHGGARPTIGRGDDALPGRAVPAGCSSCRSPNAGPTLTRTLTSRATCGPSSPTSCARPGARPGLELRGAPGDDRALVPPPRLAAPRGTRGRLRRGVRRRGRRLSGRRGFLHPDPVAARFASSQPASGSRAARWPGQSDVRRRIESLHRGVFRSSLPRRLVMPALLAFSMVAMLIGGLGITRGEESRRAARPRTPGGSNYGSLRPGPARRWKGSPSCIKGVSTAKIARGPSRRARTARRPSSGPRARQSTP